MRDVVGGPVSYDNESAAAAAEDQARQMLSQGVRTGVTVREWWEEWTTDPLWKRPAESTNLHYRERTQKFVERFGDVALRAVSDLHVAEWLKGGQNAGTVSKLETMWNDAASATAGRLVDRNPWHGLKLQKKPRKDRTPPAIDQVAKMFAIADEIAPPSFADYLFCGAHEGWRPGEADALRWTKVDFQTEEILIDEQWNVKPKAFTAPKAGHARTIAITQPAMERLLARPRESEFVFPNLQGSHWTPSSRAWHWNRVRCAAGLANVDLYTVTRHFFAWYAWNVLELNERDIALQLGHRDGGKLVRTTYGHADAELARRRLRAAYDQDPPAAIPFRRAK